MLLVKARSQALDHRVTQAGRGLGPPCMSSWNIPDRGPLGPTLVPGDPPTCLSAMGHRDGGRLLQPATVAVGLVRLHVPREHPGSGGPWAGRRKRQAHEGAGAAENVHEAGIPARGRQGLFPNDGPAHDDREGANLAQRADSEYSCASRPGSLLCPVFG